MKLKTPRKTKTTDAVEIEMVVDRSGSMQWIRNDAIGGFNTWLDAQQKVPGDANVMLNLFDHEMLETGPVPLKDVQPLTTETYEPRGSTALNDAMGRALTRLNTKNPKRAILVVVTDGAENASREFTAPQIKAMVEAANAKGWQVVYLSADLNAFTHAHNYGVTTANTMQYTADAKGMARMSASLSATNTAYRTGTVTPDLSSQLQPPGDKVEDTDGI